jgi:hypothetical protein
MSKREPSVWKLPGLASNCENVKGVGIVDAIYMYSELDTSILCTAVMKNHYEVLVRAKYESCFRSSFWSESHVTCHMSHVTLRSHHNMVLKNVRNLLIVSVSYELASRRSSHFYSHTIRS